MAPPTNPNSNVNVKNKFLRTRKVGGTPNVNQLDLGLSNWSINGVIVDATADQLNNAAAGGLSDVDNVGAGQGIFKDITSGIVNLKSFTEGSGITLTPSLDGNELQIGATGGGGGVNFQRPDTWYVASNGDDVFGGNSTNEPKKTLAGARADFTSLYNVIIIEDNATYDAFFVEDVPGAITQIQAPSATFQATVGPAFAAGSVLALIAPTLTVDCYKVIGNGAQPPLITYSENPSALFVAAKEIEGNGQDSYVAVTGDPSAGAFITAVFINGGMDFGTTAIVKATTLIGDLVTGTGLYTGALIGDIQNHIGTRSGNGPFTGFFGSVNPSVPASLYTTDLSLANKAVINECYKQEVKTSSYTLTENDSNKLITFDSASFPTCTLPDFATNPNIPAGYKLMTSMRGTGQIFFTSNDTIQSVNNNKWSNDDGATVKVLLQQNTGSSYIWAISGDLVSSNNVNTVQSSYFFAESGNNVDGNGTRLNPWADPFFAYAQVSALSPANKVNLFGLDAGTYFGELIYDNGMINLIAPQAIVASSAGDAITTTFFGEQVQINLKSLYSTFGGGKALQNNGNNSIILNVDVLLQGDLVQNGTGSIFIQSDNVQTPLICTAAGEIRGQTAKWGGVFTAGPGTVRMVSDSGFAFPAASSPYFQATPTSFLAAVIPVSASQIAGRVIVNNNAGPCTWTIDTGTNLTAQFPGAIFGDSFNVYVYNPLAATISLLSNTNAAVTGSGSNKESFVITLRYVGGNSWEIYI